MTLTALQQSRLRDPTRTTGIQGRFLRDGTRRWRAHIADIVAAIVENDVFGIEREAMFLEAHRAANPEQPRPAGLVWVNVPPPPRAYEFLRTDAKVAQFMEWLVAQEELGILEIIERVGIREGIEAAWSDVYIQSAYQRGIQRARADLRRLGVPVPPDFGPGVLFNQPIHADRVGGLYTRVFDDLRSVVEHTNAGVRRALTEGLTNGLARGVAEGKAPRTIAREISGDVVEIVEKRGIARVELIARTEVIRAHHISNITEYEIAARDTGITILADWILGANPCPICIDLEADAPYKLSEIRGLIPAHPRCVCTPSPRIVGVSPERRAEGVGRARRRPSGIRIARRRVLGALP